MGRRTTLRPRQLEPPRSEGGLEFLRSPTCRLAVVLVALCLFGVLTRPGLIARVRGHGDLSRQIRFDTAEAANASRERLIRYIWSEGLPTNSQPRVDADVPIPADLRQIELGRVGGVDRLTVDVSRWDFLSTAYLLHPADTAQASRLVIIHGGHGNAFGAGVARTAEHLLERGFTLALVHMPLSGWNRDHSGVLWDGTPFDFSQRGTAGHNEIFTELAEAIDGAVFRLFLEPVVQVINHFVHSRPDHDDVSMIGLSGGGWSTHLAAAIDTRIRLSVPVAGSAPLYVRQADPDSQGDAEQTYAPLFAEDIAKDGSGGGIATWLEIYALGGYGEERRQIMVTNEFDACCYRARFADSFKELVAERVATDLGRGRWEHVLDASHREHRISDRILREVIEPALHLHGAAIPRTVTGDNPPAKLRRFWIPFLFPGSISGTHS